MLWAPRVRIRFGGRLCELHGRNKQSRSDDDDDDDDVAVVKMLSDMQDNIIRDGGQVDIIVETVSTPYLPISSALCNPNKSWLMDFGPSPTTTSTIQTNRPTSETPPTPPIQFRKPPESRRD